VEKVAVRADVGLGAGRRGEYRGGWACIKALGSASGRQSSVAGGRVG